MLCSNYCATIGHRFGLKRCGLDVNRITHYSDTYRMLWYLHIKCNQTIAHMLDTVDCVGLRNKTISIRSNPQVAFILLPSRPYKYYQTLIAAESPRLIQFD